MLSQWKRAINCGVPQDYIHISMADGCSLVSSAHSVSNRVINFSSADILKHKECVNLSYDNKRLK